MFQSRNAPSSPSRQAETIVLSEPIANTAAEAMRRQRAISDQEFAVARAFAHVEQGVKGATVMLEQTCELRRRVPVQTLADSFVASETLAIIYDSDALMAQLLTNASTTRKRVTSHFHGLQQTMRNLRLDIFRRDFDAQVAAVRTINDDASSESSSSSSSSETNAHVGKRCMVCQEPEYDYRMRCCSQLLCFDCLTQHSFEKSHYGLMNESTCVHCRAPYAVYSNHRRRNAKRNAKAMDDTPPEPQ